MRLNKGEGIAGQVIASGTEILISNVQKDPAWAKRFDASTGFVTTSMLCVPLITKDKIIGCLQLLNKREGHFKQEDIEYANSFAAQAAVVIENSRLFKNQKELFLSLLKTLSSALDARDPYTEGHSRRVCDYSVLIGKELGLTRAELQKLREAALLHDVGKIGIRDNILLNPNKLDDKAWKKLKEHPQIGANILSEVVPEKMVEHIKEGALYHQEKYDGTGYPFGKKGTEIPLVARIIAVADTYDAMTTDRPYRKGLAKDIALAEIKKRAGSQFDPDVAACFIRAMEEQKAHV